MKIKRLHGLLGLVLVSCAGGGGGAAATDSATDGSSSGQPTTSTTDTPTSSTTTSASTTSTTLPPTTSTTGGGPDYWDDGYCANDGNTPSSPDCMDVDWVGECDSRGQAIWCGGANSGTMPGAVDNLFCFVCGAGTVCGLNGSGLYECVPEPSGTTTDSSTGTSTSTSTSG